MKKELKNISVKELYEEYSEDIFRYSYSILKNYEEARDLVQEVFLRHFENEKSFKGGCSYKTWLFIIARNLCYSIRRRKSFNNDTIENYIIKKNYSDTYDINISIRNALLKISAENSELLYLKEYEGYSYLEISKITNLSVENIAVKLYRTKKLLRKHLKDFKES
ncbi:MAG: RNA polymerase sigma factor [Ignavibacteriaceae bacterium]